MKAAREFVTAKLTEHLPKNWRVIGHEANPDTLDRLTVLVSVTAVQREESAPMGAYDTTVTLTVVSPIQDNLAAAESELEDALETVVFVIEDNFGTAWDPASKVSYADRYLAWDVPVHVTTSRKD